MIESIKDIVAREAQAILNIPIGDEYERAVNLIVHHVHELKVVAIFIAICPALPMPLVINFPLSS